MKIGLLLGSFNPFHNGHLLIAGYMAEFADLHEVWLIVSPHNPLKNVDDLLSEQYRYQLVKLGIGNNNKLKASDIEFTLSKPSYTIHTLNYLKEIYPSHEFVLILGSDCLETFDQWKDYKEILLNHQLYIYPRFGSDGEKFISHPKIKFINAPVIEISSTFIRKSIKEKKNVSYMMPDKVYNTINEKGFYR